jgi:precorrin-6B C5,15-methyltransferase / cobalt-precorrin-6B C5,C15-methyltransferase
MTPIHVIGIGLDGAAGLTPASLELIQAAQLLVGGDRHLGYFPDHPAERLVLGDLGLGIVRIRQFLGQFPPGSSSSQIVILASGDPLFFGLGRLLLQELPPESITFHPHVSAIQLAFSRIKLPWQDARLISAHGRSLQELTQALQQGLPKIAILTDAHHSPVAIAQLLLSLNLSRRYQLWVGENLGGAAEKITDFSGVDLSQHPFAPLNLVILIRRAPEAEIELTHLPAFGLDDPCFLSFADRPGLITKREVRVLALAELGLQPRQILWDIGAGTGSVGIEIARLMPQSHIYAIEKTAIGISLIQQNCQRFQVNNVTAIAGVAPEALNKLPAPDRVFIGGSGGNLSEILQVCQQQLRPRGRIVLALSTLEHLAEILEWSRQSDWQSQMLQIQLARSVAIADLTRLHPLNPVILVRISRGAEANL